ncbi:hypothetical protein GUJ93_ZPchr0260g46478 [Zizania palustris]|uniref:Kinesin motor domain-containing protein n=1 Tax=Zizania palustris TaxID=103762 RepID=A0A8J5RBG1_ZIZPA|nr:hypothetical protein GUJ93_ZPchr0260g46478 [Zizania palustris]
MAYCLHCSLGARKSVYSAGIRPHVSSESISAIEHIGNDDSLMVCDPFKSQTTRRVFQFNKIFGPATTQDEVYKETQSLIRSVMDGYNVCIFAYGQTDIRTSSDGLLNLPDAKMCPVQSPSDVLNLMLLGEKHRASSPTAMNRQSSRSHSILTVHVNGMEMSGNVSRSSLHLVDLAGSERIDRSEATGDKLKEAQLINKSLPA